mmetsp:Transcript_46760/g.84427  ORF Transcript_46760/g.84427 Transcript_46760/m.84427 type:complete len:211 (-) Transcript_46760:95-727(-)
MAADERDSDGREQDALARCKPGSQSDVQEDVGRSKLAGNQHGKIQELTRAQQRRSRTRALRERSRQSQHKSMANCAERLEAVMEERGQLGIVPEEEGEEDEVGDVEDGTLLTRARALSVVAVSSLAAISGYAASAFESTEAGAESVSSWPDDASFERRLSTDSAGSDSSSDLSVHTQGSFSSTSDSTVAVLGDALLKARDGARDEYPDAR